MNEELVRLYFQSEPQEVASSRRTRCKVILRGITEGHERLFNDYFSKAPTYTDEQFH
jgi:hypothetical protein